MDYEGIPLAPHLDLDDALLIPVTMRDHVGRRFVHRQHHVGNRGRVHVEDRRPFLDKAADFGQALQLSRDAQRGADVQGPPRPA